MGRNVEIKARLRDPDATRDRARALGDAAPVWIDQEDTFFPCARGRLKYRRLTDREGELIHYERPDRAGPSPSQYRIVPTRDGHALRDLLAASLGVRGVVRKRRELVMVGATRIHLDRVEGLGDFLELEVVLAAEQTPAQGAAIAEDLMGRLGVAAADRIETAYIDLLEQLPPGQRSEDSSARTGEKPRDPGRTLSSSNAAPGCARRT